MNYNTDSELNAERVAINASNIRAGDNPPYLVADFLAIYPQFGPDSIGKPIMPLIVIQMYIELANASIKKTRWHTYWEVAMGWFIAHFCSLYLQGTADPNSGANMVMEAGRTHGLDTSQSVGDVSVSTDYSIIANGLDGWASWLLTIYGQQLSTVGKLMGKGGFTVR
ncbi:DUF4054 domain-containing protein (plasmid) [Clostridium estertheticum]|uniref:DUF4054 domain-containing protein n=1 Tax=Clostridium estertheticum TaxID=238834 RepID=UPI001C7DA62A|nr:DUF4054 domain-containing protein [Clostridium estertheticum]MBX4259739.1 DUF4054 domain-containing protein [Clostridium estertheticum]WLC73326.1 DUF4054 domain-containing protein [Clostridium estertheticum]